MLRVLRFNNASPSGSDLRPSCGDVQSAIGSCSRLLLVGGIRLGRMRHVAMVTRLCGSRPVCSVSIL